jgi:hypothetical protein
MLVLSGTVERKYCRLPRDYLDLSFVGFVPRKNYSYEQGRPFLWNRPTKVMCPTSGHKLGGKRGLRRLTESYLQTQERPLVADVQTDSWDVTPCILFIYGFFNDAAGSSGCVVSSDRIVVNNEWVRVWKETVGSFFTVLSRH